MDTKTLKNLGIDMIKTIQDLYLAKLITKEEARELLGFEKGFLGSDIKKYVLIEQK